MRTLMNVLWLVLAGFWMALGYVLAGVICCILIITIPFGIASFRIAGYALWPFGRTAVPRRDAGTASVLGNVIWIIVAGWWLALGHLTTGVLLCISIIGIPFGIANFKLIPISLTPLGHQIVPTGDRTSF
ncbi:YccF domain-containing protein [Actinomadura decatromicini]|uniref:YccF domain-containing protein n=2 Tax=Actinomadura decatromicini TaxID=2604572 RepID=A0A5D3FUP1_9ACTN|nr:YccF domain-containing protein [Actinomadura decatromicini]TYK51450.1 YccF domain-containing protein [Actinomadura decatromicini]